MSAVSSAMTSSSSVGMTTTLTLEPGFCVTRVSLLLVGLSCSEWVAWIVGSGLVAGAGRNPCVWCDYSFICCHETGVHERALEAPAKPFEPEEEPEEEEEQP